MDRIMNCDILVSKTVYHENYGDLSYDPEQWWQTFLSDSLQKYFFLGLICSKSRQKKWNEAALFTTVTENIDTENACIKKKRVHET